MQQRYSPTQQLFHWITVLCMAAILPLAWVMTSAKDSPFNEALYNWHKTLGTIVLLITAARIFWRLADRPPAYPPRIAVWDKALAHTTYVLFFFVLLWMPITGFFTTTFDGYPTTYFNLIPSPQLLPKNDQLADLFGDLHAFGQWALYGLLGLHIAGVVFHVVFRRDGVLGRMLPAQALEGDD